MKKLLLLITLCCALSASRAQTADTTKAPPLPAHGADPDGNGPVPADSSRFFVKMTDPPAFPGGLDSLHRYLSKKMVYPPALLAAHKGGKVIVSFIVEKDGKINDIKVNKSADSELDAEAVSVLKKSPLWVPGTLCGKPMRVNYSVPITFNLSN